MLLHGFLHLEVTVVQGFQVGSLMVPHELRYACPVVRAIIIYEPHRTRFMFRQLSYRQPFIPITLVVDLQKVIGMRRS